MMKVGSAAINVRAGMLYRYIWDGPHDLHSASISGRSYAMTGRWCPTCKLSVALVPDIKDHLLRVDHSGKWPPVETLRLAFGH